MDGIKGSGSKLNSGRVEGGYSSRLTKVEFPKFGGDDLNSWLYRVEQFFELDKVPDETKTRLAAIHLEDKALQWHQSFMKNRGNVPLSWVEYKEALVNRFGQLFDDPMTELKNLKPTLLFKNI